MKNREYTVGGTIMKTNKILFALGLGCLFAVSSISEVSTGTPKTMNRRSIKKGTKKLPVPVAGKEYTLGALFNLINTNNASGNSNFLVLDKNGVSRSASTVGVSLSYIQENADTMVQLNADTERISQLTSKGVLTSKTAPQYSKILLYFELDGIPGRLYINDPAPGKVIKSSFKETNPALNIINKWDFSKSF